MIKVPTKITPQYTAKLKNIPVLIKVDFKLLSLFKNFILESSIGNVNTPMTLFVK